MLALSIEPDPDEPGCAIVRVHASVAGQSLSFVLDSGAARTQLLAPLTGARLLEQSERSAGVFGIKSDQQLAELAELTLDGHCLSELTVQLATAGSGQENLLGIDVLGRYRFELRFSTGTLELKRSDTSAAAEPLTIGRRGHAQLELEFGSARAWACWDTGAGITIVDSSFAAANPSLFSEPGSSVGTDSGGVSLETETALMLGPRIGQLQFAPSRVAFVDLASINASPERPLELIIGYPLLSQADWVIDFPARQWTAELLRGG